MEGGEGPAKSNQLINYCFRIHGFKADLTSRVAIGLLAMVEEG